MEVGLSGKLITKKQDGTMEEITIEVPLDRATKGKLIHRMTARGLIS